MIDKLKNIFDINKINQSKIIYIIINIVFGIFWFLFTYKTKLAEDDFTYQNIFWTDVRIKNIFDVFYSQYRHYFLWNGRNVAHFLDQFYLIFSKIYFDISNAIVFLVTCNLIYSLKKNKEINNSLLLIIMLSYWFFGGDVRRGMLWQTGSFNYLWMIMFSLLFLKLYYIIFDKKITKNYNVFVCVLFFIFSILAGWGHEIIGPVVLCALFIYFIYKYKNKIKFLNIEITGFIGYAIGTFMLIIAPGNFVRVNMLKSWAFANLPLLVRYLASFARNGYYFIHFTAPAIVLTMIVAHFAFQNNKKSTKVEEKYKVPFYYFILFFSVFFYFFIFGWQSTNILTSLTILNLMIVRLYDDIKDDKIYTVLNYCSYFMFLVFIMQALATLYAMFRIGAEITHSFRLY